VKFPAREPQTKAYLSGRLLAKYGRYDLETSTQQPHSPGTERHVTGKGTDIKREVI
jgi:hypothetical protein